MDAVVNNAARAAANAAASAGANAVDSAVDGADASAGAGAQPASADAHPAMSVSLSAVRLQRCPVLGPIRLDVRAATWTAVVGPNGAGKSTLLRALAGLQPAEGEVSLFGRPLRDWPARERARCLAWMGQGEPSAEGMSAEDVVMLGRLPHHGWLAPPTDEDRAQAEAAMRQTQCLAWRRRSLSTLSGGERQRVLLARALAVQARLVLMDEPLTHLDPPHQADWTLLVRALCQKGTTVIAVLHELNVALQADALVVMARGQVVHHGAPSDAATRDALLEVFDGRLQFVEIAGRWVALPR